MACARHDDMAVAYAKMGDTKMSKTILGYADMPVDMPLGIRQHALVWHSCVTTDHLPLSTVPGQGLAQIRNI